MSRARIGCLSAVLLGLPLIAHASIAAAQDPPPMPQSPARRGEPAREPNVMRPPVGQPRPGQPPVARPPAGRPPIIVPLVPFRGTGPGAGAGGGDEDAPDRPPLAIDRQTMRELDTANELLAKKNYPEAIRQLQRVLDEGEDSWIEVPASGTRRFQSAKQQAADGIGRLPRAVRQSYEAEYGQVARRMLDDATARGDRPLLEEIVRRYFHTEAGYQAAYLLANRLLDASKPLAAAALFDRLRTSPGGRSFEPMLSLKNAWCWISAGGVEKGLAIVAALRERTAGTVVKIGGRAVTVPPAGAGGDPRAWLAEVVGPVEKTPTVPLSDWPMIGGSPDRDAVAAPALPLGKPTWTQSVIRDPGFAGRDRFPYIESVLKEYEADLAERGALTQPAPEPIVIGDTAVFRTLARLRAVDLRTGRRRWDFAEPDRLYSILAAAKYPTRGGHRLPISLESSVDDLRLFLHARAFRDMTYGGIASDGQRVFAVLDMGFLGQEDLKQSPQAEVLGARNHNILAGIDLATGQLLWEIGGPRADRNRDHAGAFFLGCGLPMGSTLYSLAELDGEISLLALDPASGRTLWSQRLSFPLGRLPHFPLRRLAGANPSDASGLLVCPTTAGVVVGLDPASRTLRWEYRYHINVAVEELADPRMLWMEEPLFTRDDDTNRWLDAAPTVFERSVLLTPRDSDELHCLDLADGRLKWKRKRDDGLFLAGVVETGAPDGGTGRGAAIVVGRSGVEALRLADGSPLWKQPIELPRPAGRGYRNGTLYHLPLATGELATIDLARGRVLTRSRFPSGVQPGNLVAASGSVVMQSSAAVSGFRPTAEVKEATDATLKRQPDDPAALAVRGELDLHLGRTQAGLDDLFRALQRHADSRTQALCVSTVLENLRYDFAAARQTAARIEPLIVEPTERFEFRRLMAKGLERTGDLPGALEHDLRVAEDAALGETLVPMGESTRVEALQVIAADLGELCEKASASERSRLGKAIDEWAARQAGKEDLDELRRASVLLRALPEDVALRRVFSQKLPQSRRVEIVRQLAHLRGSAKPGVAGEATARLAKLMIANGRSDEAITLLDELEIKYGRVDCNEGQTGRDLARAWRQKAEVKRALLRRTPWPAAPLSVKRVEEDRPTRAIVSLPVDRHHGLFFRHWRFEAEQHAGERGSTLIAIDDTGRERWRLELTIANLGPGPTVDAPVAVHIHGPLLEVVLRQRFVLLDAFDGKGPPRILWTCPLFDVRRGTAPGRAEYGLAGLMTDDFVFYQVGTVLRALDIATGRTVWEHRNVPLSYLIEGDNEFVVAVARSEPNEPSGAILRTATGAEAFAGSFGITGPLPSEWNGRRVLTTTTGLLTHSLTLFDLLDRKAAWTLNFPAPALTVPIDDEEIAVLDPRGKLHIHSLETGAAIVETAIESPGPPPQVSIRRVGSRYIVIGQAPVRFPGLREIPQRMIKGSIWAIDRATGKHDWSISINVPQALIESPAEAPILALVRPVHRFETARNNGAEAVLTILDARSGKTLYEGPESTSPDRINVRLDRQSDGEPAAHRKVIVTTDKSRFEITPAGPVRSDSAPPRTQKR